MLRAVAAIALLVPAAAGSAAAGAPSPHPTAAETRAELDAVCERLTAGHNPFFGRAVVAELEARLAAAEALAPRRRLALRGRLAHELQRLGQVRRAIGLLEAARGDLELLQADAVGAGDGEIDELRGALLAALARAYLQLGEEENCVARHSGASCILPVAAAGVHAVPEPARRAGDLYLELLAARPHDVQARWLLNLARMVTGDFPHGVPEPYRLPPGAFETPPSAGQLVPWPNVAPRLGVDVVDLAGGAVMDDLDGDGRLDLVSSSWHPCEPLKAFRNRGGGTFEEVTTRWGLDGQLGGLNLVQADFDNDGMIDLLVLRGAWLGDDGRIRNSLLRNDLGRPAGRFVDVTAAAGLAVPAYPTQAAAWGDFNRNGLLDLYVGNESQAPGVDPQALPGRTGSAFPSQLFRNEGDGTFTDVARAAGVTNLRFAKGAAWGDYDDDGWPDLYVSNIGPNRLYRNLGDGTFADVAPELGVTAPEGASFATWFFDFDNDGRLDLFVASYGAPFAAVSASYLGLPAAEEPGEPAVEAPVLYRNLGGGRFADVSRRVGFDRPLLIMGANFGDLDGDGYPDLYLGTGVPDADALMPNVAYLNRPAAAGGRRFVDATFALGLGHLQKGHGVAFGDLTGNGRQDLFHQVGGAFPFDAFANALFENPAAGDAWIVLRLQGSRANRHGVGARIQVMAGTADRTRSFHAFAGSGGSFGGSSLQQEIGLGAAFAGAAAELEAVVVHWPGSGARQELRGLAPGRTYRLRESPAGAAEHRREEPPR